MGLFHVLSFKMNIYWARTPGRLCLHVCIPFIYRALQVRRASCGLTMGVRGRVFLSGSGSGSSLYLRSGGGAQAAALWNQDFSPLCFIPPSLCLLVRLTTLNPKRCPACLNITDFEIIFVKSHPKLFWWKCSQHYTIWMIKLISFNKVRGVWGGYTPTLQV